MRVALVQRFFFHQNCLSICQPVFRCPALLLLEQKGREHCSLRSTCDSARNDDCSFSQRCQSARQILRPRHCSRSKVDKTNTKSDCEFAANPNLSVGEIALTRRAMFIGFSRRRRRSEEERIRPRHARFRVTPFVGAAWQHSFLRRGGTNINNNSNGKNCREYDGTPLSKSHLNPNKPGAPLVRELLRTRLHAPNHAIIILAATAVKGKGANGRDE